MALAAVSAPRRRSPFLVTRRRLPEPQQSHRARRVSSDRRYHRRRVPGSSGTGARPSRFPVRRSHRHRSRAGSEDRRPPVRPSHGEGTALWARAWAGPTPVVRGRSRSASCAAARSGSERLLDRDPNQRAGGITKVLRAGRGPDSDRRSVAADRGVRLRRGEPVVARPAPEGHLGGRPRRDARPRPRSRGVDKPLSCHGRGRARVQDPASKHYVPLGFRFLWLTARRTVPWFFDRPWTTRRRATGRPPGALARRRRATRRPCVVQTVPLHSD
jgi:hypothetical protein